MERILVSACLAGEKTRYDGGCFKPHPMVSRWLEEGRAVCCCPEVQGSLPTPRPRAEIRFGSGEDVLSGKGSVVDEYGRDLSGAFVRGAEACLSACRENGIFLALLKEGSPSCGCTKIADGTFSGIRKNGQGVTAALLRTSGLVLFNELEVEKLSSMLAQRERGEADLRRISGIGGKLAKRFQSLGITGISDLQGKDPEELYQRLVAVQSGPVDRCVLYVLRSAVYQAETEKPDPELTKWWNWSDKNMERFQKTRR